MNSFSFILNVIGVLLGCVSASLYGIRVWQGKERANLATWGIIYVLDVVGLHLAIETGNDDPLIQFGWCIAAVIILAAAIRRRGNWTWSSTETYVLIACSLSVAVWLLSHKSAVFLSLLCFSAAVVLSAIPQARDYMRHPDIARASAWVWQVGTVSVTFTLTAKVVQGLYGVEHTLVYAVILAMNICMAYLCSRKVAV